jgi:mono/diheme cytochrome c family protein
MNSVVKLLLVLPVLAVACAGSLRAEEPAKADTPEGILFFENKVRPILVQHCHKCHADKKQEGMLRLDAKGAMLAGGESGPAIVPGKPDESLLVEAVNYKSLQMPPDRRLKPEQIATLTEWVKLGAPWPPGGEVALQPRKTALVVADTDRQHWSFQSVKRPEIPVVAGEMHAHAKPWAWHPNGAVDAFILAGLSSKGLAPSPEARKRELIRRAYFDVAGLPPSAEEIAAFDADASPDAYERLVDRLIASPRFGERWSRHWLDVVRFGQTNGLERDDEKPNAWRYRDYLIRALNRDKPYDQFLKEQLAGDEMTPLTDDAITATAYYRLGVWDDEPDDGKQAKADELDDIVATTSTAMLGLTVGCARCHDHKFDPIAQEDYYSLTAFFQNIELYGKTPDVVAGGVPVNKEGVFRDLQSGGQTLAVAEKKEPPPKSHILVRGSALAPGKEVRPRFVEVLCSSKESMIPTLPEDLKRETSSEVPVISSQGRRTVIANWIASPENPLTARVIVNRLWSQHFARGIVSTPSDFGHTGQPPSHPELLDYLASELTRGHWELKRLHRMMLTSSTYRQSSRVANEQAVMLDPDNTLLWRQNLRRLEAEAIRDTILATSGSLNLQMGGRGIFPTIPPEVLSGQSRPGNGWENKSPLAEQSRRSVYIFAKRTLGVPLLESLDAASADTSTAKRNITTVAPQALILLNSDFMEQQSAAMADRVLREAGNDQAAQIATAYRLALGRAPTAGELQVATAFLEREIVRWQEMGKEHPELVTAPAEQPGARILGWTTYGGTWKLRDDGGAEVQPSPGAKIIHDDVKFGDGTVEAQIMLGPGGGDTGLLLRVDQPAEGTDALLAYNINLRKDSVRLGKHENSWQALATAPLALEENKWHDLKIELDVGDIKIYVNGAKEPQIHFTDPKPLPQGRVGFRTYHMQTAARNIVLTKKNATTRLEFKIDKSTPIILAGPPQRALAGLCKLVMNLNEFVYVD